MSADRLHMCRGIVYTLGPATMGQGECRQEPGHRIGGRRIGGGRGRHRCEQFPSRFHSPVLRKVLQRFGETRLCEPQKQARALLPAPRDGVRARAEVRYDAGGVDGPAIEGEPGAVRSLDLVGEHDVRVKVRVADSTLAKAVSL